MCKEIVIKVRECMLIMKQLEEEEERERKLEEAKRKQAEAENPQGELNRTVDLE